MISTIVVTAEAGESYDPFYYKYPSKPCIIVLTVNTMQDDCWGYFVTKMNNHLVKMDGIHRSVKDKKELLLSIATLVGKGI